MFKKEKILEKVKKHKYIIIGGSVVVVVLGLAISFNQPKKKVETNKSNLYAKIENKTTSKETSLRSDETTSESIIYKDEQAMETSRIESKGGELTTQMEVIETIKRGDGKVETIKRIESRPIETVVAKQENTVTTTQPITTTTKRVEPRVETTTTVQTTKPKAEEPLIVEGRIWQPKNAWDKIFYSEAEITAYIDNFYANGLTDRDGWRISGYASSFSNKNGGVVWELHWKKIK